MLHNDNELYYYNTGGLGYNNLAGNNYNKYGETLSDQYGPTTDQSKHAQAKRAAEVNPIGAGAATPWGLIASLAASNLAGFYNGFNADYSASDLSGSVGTGQASKFGVQYTVQKAADAREVMDEYNKETTSKLFSGNLGGFLSRTFWGSKDQEEQIRLQNIQANRINQVGGNIAGTYALRNDFAKKQGNPENQVLLTAPGADGAYSGKAIADPLEIIVHSDGSMEKPIGGVPGKDSVEINMQPGDAVLNSNYINPETGKTHAEMAEPIYALQKYLYGLVNKNKGKNNSIAKNVAQKYINETNEAALAAVKAQHFDRIRGNVPPEQVAYADPGIDNWGNVIQTVAGLGTAISGFMQAKNSKVHKPNIAVKNPYETSALNDLYSLKPDNLAVRRQVRDAEARGRYQLRSASGLLGGQKPLAHIAMTANTQQSIANAEAQAQDRANALTSTAAQAALSTGAAGAQLAQYANQYNNTAFQQAASAKQNIMRDYLAQIPAMLGQYWKNYYQQAMGRNMLALYQQDIDLDRERLKKGLS